MRWLLGKFTPDFPEKNVSVSKQNKFLFIVLLVLLLSGVLYILSFYLK